MSIIWLEVKIPPKADTLSHDSASKYASNILSLKATPHGLLCLCIKKTDSFVSKSLRSPSADSISKRLLYEISLPCICSNILSI